MLQDYGFDGSFGKHRFIRYHEVFFEVAVLERYLEIASHYGSLEGITALTMVYIFAEHIVDRVL